MRVGAPVPISKLSPGKRFKVSAMDLTDSRFDTILSKTDPFYELVSLRAPTIVTKAQLEAEVESLTSSGMFQAADMEAVPQSDGSIKVNVKFTESQWAAAQGVRFVNVGLQAPPPPPGQGDAAEEEDAELRYRRAAKRPCLVPIEVAQEISRWLRFESRLTARMLQRIRDRIQSWYHNEGYACAQVVNFGNLNTDEVVCEIVEGDITKVEIQFQDRMGNPCEGLTQPDLITRELPSELKAGTIFNIEAGKKALRNVNALALFSNIEVNPRPDEEKEGGIVVEVKVKEMDQKTAEVSTEWSIAPGDTGMPSLIRVPVRGTHVYGFVEYGTDLGSSKDVRGNPTEFFRRAGHGGSVGVGAKLGSVRAEYARDCNNNTGSIFVRFGERF
eukprot:SM000094S24721  [mRNA]  locus=s94:538502:542137:+ [translate_table: standard]